MDWFRQSANWLVGIAAGGLAWLGAMYFDERAEEAANWVDLLYAAAALGFVVTIVSGVFFYSWLTYFANQYEKGGAAGAAPSKTVPEGTAPPAPAPAGDQAGGNDNDQGGKRDKPPDLTAAGNKYKFYFNVLKVAFPIAVVLCMIVVGAERLTRSGREVAPGSVLLIDGRYQDSVCTKYSVLKLDTKTGLVLELKNDSASGWVQWDTCHAFARDVKGADEVRIR